MVGGGFGLPVIVTLKHERFLKFTLPFSTNVLSYSHTTNVDLVYDNVKYDMSLTRCADGNYVIEMNESCITVVLYPMADGGSLIRLPWGKSCLTYVKEEVDGFRVSVAGKTCTFEKETDPSVIRASSTGKLVKYLVEDGAHVSPGQNFCLVEVMKMAMPLTVKDAGIIKFRKLAGDVLESGDILAELILDDASQIRRATLHQEPFENPMDVGSPPSGKPHQILKQVMQELEGIMKGHCYPAKFFDTRLEMLVRVFFELSADRRLPLLEMRGRPLRAEVSHRAPQLMFFLASL